MPFVIAPAITSTPLALNVVLAIFKPGWRLRWRRPGAAARLRTQQEDTSRSMSMDVEPLMLEQAIGLTRSDHDSAGSQGARP